MSRNISSDINSGGDATMQKLIDHHPLQRLKAPGRGASAALHILGLTSFILSFKWLLDNPNPISSGYGWHFQYLTIIGLFLATLTFTTGILSDLTLSRQLFLLKNTLSICSTPLAVLISTLYWGLRAIDPKLVVPPEYALPFHVDVGFHAIPAVFLLVDLLGFSPPWTITVLPALGLSGVIAFGYWFWIEYCYTRNGYYPYPLFDLLSRTERMGLFGGSAVVMAGSTAVLKWVYGAVNGVERVGELKKGVKKRV